MRIGTWFWAGAGVSVEPKGAGPKQVGGPPPSPYPPINKVSAPPQGAGAGQEALVEENPGLLPPSFLLILDLATGQCPTGPLRCCCSRGWDEMWDLPHWRSLGWGAGFPCGQSRSEAAQGRLRWGLHWGHCAHPRSGPSLGHS